MQPDEVRPGEMIAGKYRVRAILGRGRGLLVDADNVAFEQRVAIRIVSPALAEPVAVEQFRREAKILAKLASEHVARIIDVGTLPDGSFYLVRQYLEGTSLAQYMDRRGPLTVDAAVGFTIMALEALAEAHAHGVLLRELEPDALFVAERSAALRAGPPILKLVDFGTAKLFREAHELPSEELTATGILGLSPYSSPEMMRRDSQIDPTTDLWSLGAILYAMLVGRPPFSGDMAALAIAIAHDDPAPIRRTRRDVPEALERAVLACLAKDKRARPQHAYALAAALLPYAPAEARPLVERIRTLVGAPEEDLEISEVEEVTAGDDDEPATRMVSDVRSLPMPGPKPAARAPSPPRPATQEHTEAIAVSSALQAMAGALGPKPSAAPRKLTEEKTEALGFSFQAIDPGPPVEAPLSARSVPKAPTFGGGPPLAPPSAPGSGPGIAGPPPSAPYPMGGGPMSAHGAASAHGAQSAPGMDQVAFQRRAPTMVDLAHAPPSPQRNMGQRVALYAVLGAAAALAIFAVIILLLPTETAPPAQSAATSPSAITAATNAAATSAPATTDTPTHVDLDAVVLGDAPPTTTGKPVGGTTRPSDPRPPGTTGPATTAATTSTTTATSKPTATTAPPTGGDGPGTLVAIATGGTCAFSVNGASKGTTNSLKLSVAPGSYTVTCKPASGATKSKSVAVKSGATAMAMFKL